MRNFLDFLKTVKDFALDCLLPKNCLGCKAPGTYLCDRCLDSILLSPGINCPICNHRSPSAYTCSSCRKKSQTKLAGLLVASDWENPLLKEVIYSFKYNFVSELAEPLSIKMARYFTTNFLSLFSIENLIFIPVPLHRKRLAWRGFNQAELLAKKLSWFLTIPVAEKILVRHRSTTPQAEIKNKEAREKNIRQAFSLSKNLAKQEKNIFKNKIIILIDDVATTCSTLEECAEALAPLSPKEVWGFVIARG